MEPIRDGRLQRGGVDLHYVEWDPSDGVAASPAVVLLHGLGSNARYWDRVAGYLEGRRLVALDQRAHGLTGSRPGMSFAVEELLDDIAHVVTDLGLDRPVVVGHSWGASVALEFVARESAAASGLVFVDGPLMGIAQIFSWEDVEATMQPRLPRYATMDEAIADSKRHLSEAWEDDLRQFVEGGLVREGDGYVPSMTAAARQEILHGLYRSSPATLWPRVNVPAIALVATRKQPIFSEAASAALASLHQIAPQVATLQIETPHDIPLYAPAEVARAIDHIARQAEAVSA